MVTKLTDNQAKVLYLREIEGLKFQEIADAMGWKRNAGACDCYHRAVKKREILRRKWLRDK